MEGRISEMGIKLIFEYLDFKSTLRFYEMGLYKDYLNINNDVYLKYGKYFTNVLICDSCLTNHVEILKNDMENIYLHVDEVDIDAYEFEKLIGFEYLIENTINRIYSMTWIEYMYEKNRLKNNNKEKCLFNTLKDRNEYEEIYNRVLRIYRNCIENYDFDVYCKRCGKFGHDVYTKSCLYENKDKWIGVECKKVLNGIINEIEESEKREIKEMKKRKKYNVKNKNIMITF